MKCKMCNKTVPELYYDYKLPIYTISFFNPNYKLVFCSFQCVEKHLKKQNDDNVEFIRMLGGKKGDSASKTKEVDAE